VFHFYTVDDSRPTIQALQHARITTAVSVKWFQLGIELIDNTRVGQLDVIKANNTDVLRCCLEMFSYWLKTYPNANWYELVAALRAPGVDMNEVAATVKKTFIG